MKTRFSDEITVLLKIRISVTVERLFRITDIPETGFIGLRVFPIPLNQPLQITHS
jgi:hypothetical protein